MWHSADVRGDGSRWHLQYPDGTTFRWKVAASSHHRVEWLCEEGPGNAAGTRAIFTLSDAEGNRTLVELTHTGWTEADPKFRKCNTLWGGLLHELKRLTESSATAR